MIVSKRGFCCGGCLEKSFVFVCFEMIEKMMKYIRKVLNCHLKQVNYALEPVKRSSKLLDLIGKVTNLLLSECEGRTGEYWPEVVAVPYKTTEGQYSLVRLELARLLSSLLYGTLFVIVKYTSGGLHLKGFRREVFAMTRAAQTKASYHEFEKQIY